MMVKTNVSGRRTFSLILQTCQTQVMLWLKGLVIIFSLLFFLGGFLLAEPERKRFTLSVPSPNYLNLTMSHLCTHRA